MKLENLMLPEQASGYTHKLTVTHADLLAAVDNTLTLDLLDLGIGQVIGRAALRLVTPFDFSDATLTSLAATLGDAGSANRYIASTELCVDGSEVLHAVNGTGAPFAYNAAGKLQLALTGTAAKLLNTATAGQLVVLAQVVDLTRI